MALFFEWAGNLMSKITAIRNGRRQGKRVNMFLDGQFAFSLEAETAAKEGYRLDRNYQLSRLKRCPGLTTLTVALMLPPVSLAIGPGVSQN